MGWIHRDDESVHEGFVVALLPDGTDAPRDTWEEGETAAGQDLNWAWSIRYDGKEERQRAAGVRVTCLCGWSGPRQKPDFTDPNAVDTLLRQQWFHHVEVSLAKTLPPHVQKLVDALEEAVLGLTAQPGDPDQLDDFRPLAAVNAATFVRFLADSWQESAVKVARSDYSWEEIARALGISRQSAHERFNRR